MTKTPASTTPSTEFPSDGQAIERLLAEHRDRIIKLEAGSVPSESEHEAWDEMMKLLAELKQHQAHILPDESAN